MHNIRVRILYQGFDYDGSFGITFFLYLDYEPHSSNPYLQTKNTQGWANSQSHLSVLGQREKYRHGFSLRNSAKGFFLLWDQKSSSKWKDLGAIYRPLLSVLVEFSF